MQNKPQGPPQPTQADSSDELPRATIRRGWRFSPVWIVPLVVIGFIGWLLFRTFVQAGPSITIRFRDGKGIETGKTIVKYRGVRIGDVTGLKLSSDQQSVEVQAQLDGSAKGLARAGSRFWIVHPEFTLSGIRGLKTIVSGDYIQVEPGDGPSAKSFTGLEEQPNLQISSSNSLHLVLLASQLRSVAAGTPVLYRGIKVGEAVKSDLSADAQTVEVHVFIYPPFTKLVRSNSKFWNAGGVNFNVGLFGSDITTPSLQALLGGALAFATPEAFQEAAPNDTAFRLYEKPQDEWLNWAPAIHLPGARTNSIDKPNE
jgi:paraquat-inducible protein B